MSAETDMIIATLSRLEGKIDEVASGVATMRTDHGERLAKVEARQERLLVLDGDVRNFTSAIQLLPAEIRVELAEERKDLSDRLDVLENQQQQQAGAAWAFGAIWTLMVAMPGVIALWAGWGGEATP